MARKSRAQLAVASADDETLQENIARREARDNATTEQRIEMCEAAIRFLASRMNAAHHVDELLETLPEPPADPAEEE